MKKPPQMSEPRENRDGDAMLNAMLNEATPTPDSAALKTAIMAQYSSLPMRRTIEDIFHAIAAWRLAPLLPAGALAGVGALGLALGAATASEQGVLAPEIEAYAYLDEFSADMLLDEEEAVQWTED